MGKIANLKIQSNSAIFYISPLIKLTLLSLYIALTLPLPFLARSSSASLSPFLLWLGIAFGAMILYGFLSERVILDEEKIEVTYPSWISKFWRRGWSLSWQEIKNLKMRTTGQGGLVYYFTCHSSPEAYLLPMRIAGFARMVKIVEEKTGIDTTDIRPLSQPWMYLILFVCSLFLLLIDFWTIGQAISLAQ